MDNQFARIENLIGKENLNKIANSVVMILGLGGVGGYALEGLCRSGVGNIIIVDSDDIDKTNLNRQIIALNDNIGKKKTDEFIIRCQKINPKIKIIKHDLFVTKENYKSLFDQHIDYVVDAIDTLSTKVAIWKYCQENNIKLISSLGMAKRLDPTSIYITTLDKTENDPMARSLRYQARKAQLSLKIPVVCSKELPMNNDETLGSMIFVPATAGLTLSFYVINDIIKQ